jgi:SHS2 domain-containing protein
VQPFRVLEHTADVGFEAQGRTRAEVFGNAGFALMSLIADPESVRPETEISMAAQARDAAGLLVNWLSEILYLQDTEGWLFHDFEVEAVTDTSVRGVGRGERFNPERHRINLLVKAITYHQLILEKRADDHWRAQVYVDI